MFLTCLSVTLSRCSRRFALSWLLVGLYCVICGVCVSGPRRLHVQLASRSLNNGWNIGSRQCCRYLRSEAVIRSRHSGYGIAVKRKSFIQQNLIFFKSSTYFTGIGGGPLRALKASDLTGAKDSLLRLHYSGISNMVIELVEILKLTNVVNVLTCVNSWR
jgi:hypothetical protein